MRGQRCVSPTPIKSFPPFLSCDVTYAISEPRPSAILIHGGQRSRVTIARAEGLGTRLRHTCICRHANTACATTPSFAREGVAPGVAFILFGGY